VTAQASFNPRNGLVVPAPAPDTPEAVDAVVATAAAAAEPMAAVPPATRAGWLTAIADAVEADAEPLADEETALGLPRLTGELAGAARALRFYGSVAAEGSYLQAAIDHAAPGRPEVRRVNVPLGPVAVFGASNFPFGFGVLGHDTASAPAAGCPVVVKAHPAHPRLSARLAEIAGETMAGAGVTTGPFGIVHGFDAGTRLVSHPAVRAVGFTGSLAGGLALWRPAASRPEMIPVYGEMGTVNTVVVTPSAAAERPAEIAAGFVSSFTLGMGQFCTRAGLLLAPAGSGLAEETGRALAAAARDGWLLTEAIAGAYHSGLDRLASAGGRVVAQLPAAPAGWAGTPTVLAVDAAALTSGSPLLEECFGPVALVAEYGSEAELASVLAVLAGSLAAGVHAAGEDDPQLAGRPVAFQDVPAVALPAALRDDNPWRVPRRVDGVAA
jgi:NADP-dependent aldehyde dehydrogenase